ncbi:MAG: hypothetical protein K0S09_1110 [Sphingobacteriaceae bacterium]|jgi:hypothetical protein|nr:hypothetical protein [Sphingobacteriaceae bacterium]
MVKRLLFFVLLSVAFAAVTGTSAFASGNNDGRANGFFLKKLFKHKTDSLRSSVERLQDTSKKKIKEIAPAKRQPKPERINEPAEGGRPGVISRPPVPEIGNGFPDARGVQPGNSRPQRGGSGDSRPPQSGGGPGPGGGGHSSGRPSG